MFYLKFILLLTILASCRSAKINKNDIAITTFESDSSLLSELNKPKLWYEDLSGIIMLTNKIDQRKEVLFLDNKPKIIFCDGKQYIVYPGEKIKILIDKNGDLIFQSENNKERTKELAFQNSFQTAIEKIKPNFQGRDKDYSIDTILSFEQEVKSEILTYPYRSARLLDSLAIIYHINDQFKLLCNSIFKNEQYNMLYNLYQVYKAELKKSNLFNQKLKEISPIYNSLTNRQDFDLSIPQYYIQSLADNKLKTKINKVNNDEELKEAMDSINGNFSNLSRDYLLAKLLYIVNYKKIKISKKNWKYFKRSCKDDEYRKLIRKLFSSTKKINGNTNDTTDNKVISSADFKSYTIEEIIKKEKGKLILLDFWASWCAPCIEEIENTNKLKQLFPGEQLSIIYLSFDKELIRWNHANADLLLETNYSYKLQNFDKQSFIKKYKVEEIPRYMLINQWGNLIDANAPKPSDPKLKELMQKYLK